MNLIYGLFFLVATISLLVGYALAVYVLIVGIQRIICRMKITGWNTPEPIKLRPWSFYSHKAYTKIALLAAVILTGVYTHQRIEWMGEDNAHFEAKEYWAAGQVVASIRLAGTLVLHPDNFLLWPYNLLQETIYNKGIQYLPKDDGELGVWTDMWFIYPYNRRGLLPKVRVKGAKWFPLIDPVHTAKQTFPKITGMLDRCWFAIETMATKPYRDQKMKVQHYYRNFPRIVTYYHVYERLYVPWGPQVFRQMIADPVYLPRNEKLVEWLENIKREWEASGFYPTMWEKYPMIGADQASVRLSILQNLLQVVVINKEFRCGHPLVDKVYKGFLELMSGDYHANVLLRYGQQDKRQAAILYRYTVYSKAGQMCRRILERSCKKEFPKEKLLLITQSEYDGRWSDSSVGDFLQRDLDFYEGGER